MKGNYKVKFTNRAKKDISFWAKDSSKDYHKLLSLFVELREHPRTGSGNPKRLNDKDRKWSRRINDKDRLVYKIYDKIVEVEVVSARGHYDDH